jgi:hypothetical protein
VAVCGVAWPPGAVLSPLKMALLRSPPMPRPAPPAALVPA